MTAAPDDPWADFLAPPMPAVRPPAAPRSPMARVVEKSAPPPESVIALGAPPDDAMGAAKWMYQAQMRLAYDCMMDATMTASRRRKEFKEIASAAAKWMTDALRYDVAKTIEDDRRQLDAKRRGRAAAKAGPRSAPPPHLAKVIPITRDA